MFSCISFISFISFISSNTFIDIQLSIHLYPAFYPSISLFILIYPHLISLFILIYPDIYPFYPDIYPAGYSTQFSPDPASRSVLLNLTLFSSFMSCSATG